MEIVILRDFEITFSTRQLENDIWVSRSSGSFKADINPTVDEYSDNEIYCDYLSTAIIERPWSTKIIGGPETNWDMKMEICFPIHGQSLSDNQIAGKLKISSNNSLGEVSFLNILHEMFIKNTDKEDDKDNILVNVDVKNFGLVPGIEDDAYRQICWTAAGVKLCKNEKTFGGYCIYNHLEFPEKMLSNWTGNSTFRGIFTVSLVLTNSALSMLYSITLTPSQRFSHLKEALDDETCTDTEILVGSEPNQVAVKCHRLMLVAGGNVFKTMFQSGMKESKESKIEIPEMSEKGARAMLAYLYYRGMKDVYEDGKVAVELFQAAEKYGLEELSSEITIIFRAKRTNWFTVDVALELLVFVDKLWSEKNNKIDIEHLENQDMEDTDVDENIDDNGNDSWEILKRKAVKVLKWHAKRKPRSVMESEKYQEIFRENPKLGMEVGLCFLQI